VRPDKMDRNNNPEGIKGRLGVKGVSNVFKGRSEKVEEMAVWIRAKALVHSSYCLSLLKEVLK
jgi:hypothetical protein